MIVWDTSALLPAFESGDSGHKRSRNLLDGNPKHGGSPLLRPELSGGLLRRLEPKLWRSRRLDDLLARLWKGFNFIYPDPFQWVAAERLALAHHLRGADAVHLAAALALAARIGKASMRFASGDSEQLAAARREGLRVIALSK